MKQEDKKFDTYDLWSSQHHETKREEWGSDI